MHSNVVILRTDMGSVVICLVALCAAASAGATAPAGPPTALPAVEWLRAELVARLPFDRSQFTEGLAFAAGGERLLVGSGLWGRSGVRAVALDTGSVISGAKNAEQVFGEGVAESRGRVYQLTYHSRYALVYNSTTMELLGRARYPQGGPREGWGLAAAPNGTLYATDGSRTVYVMEPDGDNGVGLRLVRTLATPVRGLNEIEWVEGALLANVYQTECLVRLSPSSGDVLSRVDASGLWPGNRHPSVLVLNGVAYSAAQRRLFLAGKMWPHLYEVRLVPGKPARCRRAEATMADSLLTSVLLMGGTPDDVEQL